MGKFIKRFLRVLRENFFLFCILFLFIFWVYCYLLVNSNANDKWVFLNFAKWLVNVVTSHFIEMAAFIISLRIFWLQREETEASRQLRNFEAIQKHFEQTIKINNLITLRDDFIEIINQDSFAGFLDFDSLDKFKHTVDSADEKIQERLENEFEDAIFFKCCEYLKARGITKFDHKYRDATEGFKNNNKEIEEMHSFAECGKEEHRKKLIKAVNDFEKEIKECGRDTYSLHQTMLQKLGAIEYYLKEEIDFIKNKQQNGEIYTETIEQALMLFLCQGVTSSSDWVYKRFPLTPPHKLAQYLYVFSKKLKEHLRLDFPKEIINNNVYKLFHNGYHHFGKPRSKESYTEPDYLTGSYSKLKEGQTERGAAGCDQAFANAVEHFCEQVLKIIRK